MSPEVVACELYDLQTDPRENVNVSGDPRYKERLAELSVKLEKEWPANRKITHVTE
jgi:hypothetical protein